MSGMDIQRKKELTCMHAYTWTFSPILHLFSFTLNVKKRKSFCPVECPPARKLFFVLEIILENLRSLYRLHLSTFTEVGGNKEKQMYAKCGNLSFLYASIATQLPLYMHICKVNRARLGIGKSKEKIHGFIGTGNKRRKVVKKIKEKIEEILNICFSPVETVHIKLFQVREYVHSN